MQFGRIINQPCENEAPPIDNRCADPAFSIANPDICGVAGTLILKPGNGLACLLGSIQFKAFIVKNGIELDVTSDTIFTSSDTTVAVIGSRSGNATGISSGAVVISALYENVASGSFLTASANLTVFGEEQCCDQVSVALMVLIDVSKSMSQKFSASYPTRLHYAKAAANRFITEIDIQKDTIGLISFAEGTPTVLSAPTSNAAAVAAMLPPIVQTQQLTGFNLALAEAVSQLDSVDADEKVILVISDGEDTTTNQTDKTDAITTANAFKDAGGVIMCFGTRASGNNFLFLEAISTGGFFVNAYPTIQSDALDLLSGLKGYVCAGNCAPPGDVYQPTPQLHYCGFINWNVYGGAVDLLGPGLNDFLPGNGQYVNLFGNFNSGATSFTAGKMVSKESFSLTSGKNYRLSLNLAGNQVNPGASNNVAIKVFGRNADGLDDPTTAPGIVVNESGNALSETPTYSYVYTWVNANGETIASSAATATPTTDAAATVITPVDNELATSIKIYRTTGETGSSTYYQIAEIENGETYTDYMTESDMLAALALGTVDSCANPPSENTSSTLSVLLNQTVSINNEQQPFTFYSFTFTAPADMDAWISFQQTAINVTPSTVNHGILLDSVKFDDVTDLVNLLTDDFSDENLQYVPPACGVGTTYVPMGGGNGVTNLVPTMTSDTTPSGEASDHTGGSSREPWKAFDGNDSTFWNGGDVIGFGYLQYQFTAARIITSYRALLLLENPDDPALTFALQGSNNGSDWTELDTQGPLVAGTTEIIQSISNTNAYAYYRLQFSETDTTNDVFVYTLELRAGGSGYGYMSGYNCYGDGCLNDTPPAAQLPDPNPLPNIEQGYTPPKQFTSTKTVCLTCPAGSSLLTSFIASVTGDHVGNVWTLTYTMGSDVVILGYSIRALNAGSLDTVTSWVFQGSADGSAWNTLDSRSGISFFLTDAQVFTFSNSTAYPFYRIVFQAASVSSSTGLLTIASGSNQQVCATASATSEVSQQNADAAATALATQAAQSQMNCVPVFTATEQYTATCPAGSFGTPNSITKSATATSLLSQSDAEQTALEQAQAAALAALNCNGSNNSQKITIPDLGPATPFPSVKYVSGQTGLVTKVVVILTGLTHGSPHDLLVVLMSPSGETCILMQLVGTAGVSCSNIALVFDDAAGSSLPASGAIAAGTYKPTAFAPNQTLPAPAPQPPYGTTLAEFIGVDANGSWSLWVIDVATFDSGQILSWDLTITSA